MRNSADYFASIDIGTSNIVVLVAQKLTNGKLRIVAKSRVQTKPNTMVRGEIKNLDVVSSIAEALSEIEKNYGLTIKSAFVGLSGQHIVCEKHTGYAFIRNSEGAVDGRDVEELMCSMRSLKFEPGKDVISILPQTYILDGVEHTDPLGMLGNKLEGIYNIVIGDKENIRLFSRVLGKLNVSISNLLLSSIASSRAVLIDGEKELGVMVVDIGAGTTDISIYYDNNLKYMGVIPIGGNLINRDIRSIGVLEKYIERLKVYHGNALATTADPSVSISLPSVGRASGKEIPEVDLANIIEARLMDIITFITDILNVTGLKHRLAAGIILTGGGANIKNIDQLFEKHFDCQIRIASPVEYVDEEYHGDIDDPMYATAVGLLLEGFESGEHSEVYLAEVKTTEGPALEVVIPRSEQPAEEHTLFDQTEIQKEQPKEQPAVAPTPQKEVEQEEEAEDTDDTDDDDNDTDTGKRGSFWDKLKKNVKDFVYEKE